MTLREESSLCLVEWARAGAFAVGIAAPSFSIGVMK
jgi:hypothetical protein